MTKNDKPLGRGLGALLGGGNIPTGNGAHYVVGNNSFIRLESIEANPYQPRTQFDEEELQELAQSIKTYGLIQPVTVRPIENGKYQLISGERRFRAAKIAGLTEIPAFVRTVDDVQSVQMALVENIQRSDLNAIEIALCYQLLIEECHLNKEELADQLGKDRSTVSNYLRLLKLSSETQIAVRDKKISMGHARALVVVEDHDVQNKIVRQIINEGLSVRQTETLVKKLTSDVKSTKTKVKITLADDVRTFQSAFSKKLQTKVNIKKDITGKGTMTIPFESDDDLRRIMNLLQ
ncbi:MAG: ParB/RepB/Spo0J family partition protein [Bacteroidales bacterium]|nr:ParB/RepB/Spo0J family partition protein [Bacteroidales bacterium]MBO7647841.1 ParB/RepB/Spo0J family partition protein [Bacteroidales bacterium]MCR4856698.1 ParB/RepB/Spo0J family partition protein [Bacteroidales bacterium]